VNDVTTGGTSDAQVGERVPVPLRFKPCRRRQRDGLHNACCSGAGRHPLAPVFCVADYIPPLLLLLGSRSGVLAVCLCVR
jgi:hypothetical protein